MQSLRDANKSIRVDRQQPICRPIIVLPLSENELCSKYGDNRDSGPRLGVDPRLLRLYKAMDLAG